MSSFPSKHFCRNVILAVAAMSALIAYTKPKADTLTQAPYIAEGNTSVLTVNGAKSKSRNTDIDLGIWELMSGEVNNVNVCGFETNKSYDLIGFHMEEGNKNDLFLVLQKPTWNITPGKTIDVYLTFDDHSPLHLSGFAGNAKDNIFVTATGMQSVAILDGMMKGSVLTVGFADVTEHKWKLPLKGTKNVLVGLYICMGKWQRLSN